MNKTIYNVKHFFLISRFYFTLWVAGCEKEMVYQCRIEVAEIAFDIGNSFNYNRDELFINAIIQIHHAFDCISGYAFGVRV